VADKKTKTELAVSLMIQQFFNDYLTNIFPKQLAAVIGAHNQDVDAHREQIGNRVDVAIGKLKLWVAGIIFVGGIGSGVGLSRAAAAFFAQ
jgi:hypothetical protein